MPIKTLNQVRFGNNENYIEILKTGAYKLVTNNIITAFSQGGASGIIVMGGIGGAGGGTVSPRMVHTGGNPAINGTDGTDAIPVVTEVYVAELFVPCTMPIAGIAILNGSAVAGALIVAMYNALGVVVASSTAAGTTAAGINTYQRIPFTAAYTAIGPATYHVSVQANNVAYRYRAHKIGTFATFVDIGEGFGGTVANLTPPPTTFVPDKGPIAGLY